MMMRDTLRKSPAAVIILLLVCAAASAQEVTAELDFDGVTVDFVLPEGFSALSAEEIASRYSHTSRPLKHVFGDPERKVLLVAIATDYDPPDDYLPRLKKQLEQDAEADCPRLEWLKRDYVKINSSRWLRLSFKCTDADGVEAVNDYYHIASAGKLVTLNFNGAPPHYQRHKAALEKSARTVMLGVKVIAPATPGAR